MKLLALERAEGEVLGRPVRDGAGRILISAGVVLSPRYVEALSRRGFHEVHVVDPVAPDVDVDDSIQAETRGRAYEAVRTVFADPAQCAPGTIGEAKAAVDDILNELMTADRNVLSLQALRSSLEYTFVHSVNVCALSLLIGLAERLDRGDLRRLGMGALLHDVGMTRCADLAGREGDLSAEELERIRRHPVDGYEMLRGQEGVHLFSAHIALQHHERLDGSGYPRGLRSGRILPFAKIVAVADSYDAMTADRPWRGAKHLQAAMAELLGEAGTKYDATAVQHLARRLAVYPNGTVVRLSSGELAAVVGQGTRAEQPVVRVVSDPRMQPVAPQDVALEENAEGRTIAEVLPDWPATFAMRVKALVRGL